MNSTGSWHTKKIRIQKTIRIHKKIRIQKNEYELMISKEAWISKEYEKGRIWITKELVRDCQNAHQASASKKGKDGIGVKRGSDTDEMRIDKG